MKKNISPSSFDATTIASTSIALAIEVIEVCPVDCYDDIHVMSALVER